MSRTAGEGGESDSTPPRIRSVADALAAARRQHPTPTSQADKKNFAELFSRNLATCFANALRSRYPGISPDESGKRQERRARTGKGFKKLDVNYSTVDLGLALGVSIKTINARDDRTRRYAKNFTRVDSELRAEAADYHKRQPYAVLAALIFLPEDACSDAAPEDRSPLAASSFGSAVRHFRHRTGRQTPTDDVELFEIVFVALYGDSGTARFFDVRNAPPRRRRPHESETASLEAVIDELNRVYDNRNDPPFHWADGAVDASS